MQLDYPDHVLSIKEIAYIFAQEEKVGTKYEDAVQNVEDDIHITTARESGIARREKILGISPLDTDSLEDRRFRVRGQWYDVYPYTMPDLIHRLDMLLGKNGYTIALDYEEEVLTLLVELTRRRMLLTVMDLLEKIVPLNITMSIGLRYNQHYRLRGYTHGDMAAMTHYAIRAEELGGA